MKARISAFGSLVIALIVLSACSGGGGFISDISQPNAQQANTGSQPAAQPAVAEPATPTEEVNPTEVLYMSGYLDNFGYYHVTGEIRNISDTPISSLKIHVRMLDAQGNVLATKYSSQAEDDVYTMRNKIAAGETTPFDYYETLAEGVTPASFDVTYVKSDRTEIESYDSIAIENLYVFNTIQNGTVITGEFVNTGTQPAWIADSFGEILDATGQVLAAENAWGENYLAPAGDPSGLDRSPFEVMIPASFPDATQQVLLYRAYVEPLAEQSPLALTIQGYYTDWNGTAHVVGWIENNGTTAAEGVANAILYDASGHVLSIDNGGTLVYDSCLAAGEKIPFDFSNFTVWRYTYDMSKVVDYSIRLQPRDFMSTDPWSCLSDCYLAEASTKDVTIEDKGDGFLSLEGTVTNPSTGPLKSMTVLFYFTDASGKVYGVAADYLYKYGSDIFAAGEAGEVDTNLYLQPGTAYGSLDFHILVIGKIP
jgi:hypothetical protein